MERDCFYTPDDDFVHEVLTLLATEEDQEIDHDPRSDDSSSDVASIAWINKEDTRVKRKPRKRTPSIPRDSNRSRSERRYEAWSLREQVGVLEARLQELQQRADVNPHPQVVSNDSSALAWQAVAQCQHDRLVAVEKTHKERRKLIRKYKNLFKQVEKLLFAESFSTTLRSLQPLSTSLELARLDGFDVISRNVSTMYLQRHAVFQDPRFQASSDDLYDIHMTRHMSIESVESRLFPFSMERTAMAMWHFHQVKSQQVFQDIDENVAQTDNIIRRTFVMSVDTSQCKFQSYGRVETHRVVEQDYVMFLQHIVFDEATQSSGMAPEGYIMRQFQWTMISPPRNEAFRASGRAVCQIDRFEVMIPCKESMPFDLDKDHAVLTQVVIEASHEIREKEREMIEHYLLTSSYRDDYCNLTTTDTMYEEWIDEADLQTEHKLYTGHPINS